MDQEDMIKAVMSLMESMTEESRQLAHMQMGDVYCLACWRKDPRCNCERDD